MATIILAAEDRQIVQQDWGRLIWFASRALGNSTDLTLGQCVIRPGQANPRHSHPNCSETLHVLQGRILHTIDGEGDAELNVGDTITVPPNFAHRARNIGDVEAVLLVAFSSADRQVKGE